MSMYFKTRKEAGFRMIEHLAKYKYEDSVLVALNEGGVLVGEPIATHFKCLLTMLVREDVLIRGEPEAFGSVTQDGALSYNHQYSDGEREEWYNEYHGNIEEQKREKFQKINRLLGDIGLLNIDMIKNKTVILVADGLIGTSELDTMSDLLKHVVVTKTVIATPLANVAAVDRMHIIADELCIINVYDDLLDIEHYYDEKTMPSREELIKKLQAGILLWQ